ncbi:MAG: ethanolamine ammonia-lyase reactivating factor EutA [Candidatus Puniceispirillum sp.]
MTSDSDNGGRVYFSSAERSLIEEDEIILKTVGVDIGSATSHILFSEIYLERLDTRYIVSRREIIHRSDILLTPYSRDQDIDKDRLGAFFDNQYELAGLSPDDIDTGALILTGVAVRRRNARAIGDLFAAQSGKFVSVSAGDGLEAIMAGHGSGAASLSSRIDPGDDGAVLNIDIGGGTTKLALCRGGEVVHCTAVDAGARLVTFDDADIITHIEPFGQKYLAMLGRALKIGDVIGDADKQALAAIMVDQIMAATKGMALDGLYRLSPLPAGTGYRQIVFSGGVCEYIAVPDLPSFGDLGKALAISIAARVTEAGIDFQTADLGIRATVIGASQYTVQVSGSTIYFDPPDILPIRNVPVIAPEISIGDEVDSDLVAAQIKNALTQMNLADTDQPVALAVPWQGSASFMRLRGFARGVLAGLDELTDRGHPLILVVRGDIAGLLGIHFRAEEGFAGPIISIDGIEVSNFDFIDIGAVLRSTGSTPVVIKSLIFPSE